MIQMVPNYSKWSAMVVISLKWSQLFQNNYDNFKLIKMVRSGPKNVLNCPKWYPYCPKWGPYCPKWSQVLRNGPKRS